MLRNSQKNVPKGRSFVGATAKANQTVHVELVLCLLPLKRIGDFCDFPVSFGERNFRRRQLLQSQTRIAATDVSSDFRILRPLINQMFAGTGVGAERHETTLSIVSRCERLREQFRWTNPRAVFQSICGIRQSGRFSTLLSTAPIPFFEGKSVFGSPLHRRLSLRLTTCRNVNRGTGGLFTESGRPPRPRVGPPRPISPAHSCLLYVVFPPAVSGSPGLARRGLANPGLFPAVQGGAALADAHAVPHPQWSDGPRPRFQEISQGCDPSDPAATSANFVACGHR